jgi:hypothetical protein
MKTSWIKIFAEQGKNAFSYSFYNSVCILE